MNVSAEGWNFSSVEFGPRARGMSRNTGHDRHMSGCAAKKRLDLKRLAEGMAHPGNEREVCCTIVESLALPCTAPPDNCVPSQQIETPSGEVSVPQSVQIVRPPLFLERIEVVPKHLIASHVSLPCFHSQLPPSARGALGEVSRCSDRHAAILLEHLGSRPLEPATTPSFRFAKLIGFPPSQLSCAT